jgi:hypothetical protein
MAYAASSPVSAAVFGLLQAAAMVSALPGGWHDDVPQNPTYPFGWYEVRERDIRGFGTGGMPEVELRTHIFSTYGGLAEAQEANRVAIGLLKDQALTVDGYAQAGLVFYDETVPLPDQELNGQKVHELVSFYRVYVEESL